eukprot:8327751-Alexandrium_andersonii.AAC.1
MVCLWLAVVRAGPKVHHQGCTSALRSYRRFQAALSSFSRSFSRGATAPRRGSARSCSTLLGTAYSCS